MEISLENDFEPTKKVSDPERETAALVSHARLRITAHFNGLESFKEILILHYAKNTITSQFIHSQTLQQKRPVQTPSQSNVLHTTTKVTDRFFPPARFTCAGITVLGEEVTEWSFCLSDAAGTGSPRTANMSECSLHSAARIGSLLSEACIDSSTEVIGRARFLAF